MNCEVSIPLYNKTRQSPTTDNLNDIDPAQFAFCPRTLCEQLLGNGRWYYNHSATGVLEVGKLSG